MRIFCCVEKCTSNSNTETMISFPDYPPLLREWIKPFRVHVNPTWTPDKNDKICLKHFRNSDINWPKDGVPFKRLRVKSSAKPHYFPWNKDQIAETTIKVKKSKKVRADNAEQCEPETKEPDVMCLTRESVEKALKLISGEVPIDSLIKKGYLHKCNNTQVNVRRKNQKSILSPDSLMELLRIELLQHNWDGVRSLLPKLFNKRCERFIWKTALQVICHHPNSSPDLLQDLLQTCLRTNNISPDLMQQIFCTPTLEDSLDQESYCDENISDTDMPM